MTNEQKEIKRLTDIINKFKKYDLERRKYYKNSLVRLGQLETFVAELEEESEPIRLLAIYKQQIISLTKKLKLSKIADLSDEQVDNLLLQEKIKKLEETVQNLKNTNSELIYKLLRK